MRLALAIGLLVLASRQASPAPFETEVWPGEGRPIFEAMATRLPVWDAPSKSAGVVRHLRVLKGQRLSFDETRYRTVAAGQLRALAVTSVTGRMLGPVHRLSRKDYYRGKFPPADVAVKAGEMLEYLQYRAEGTCFVRLAGQVIDADPCPAGDESLFRVEAEPELEWWIQVTWNGKRAGWLLIDDTNVKIVDRAF